MATEWKTVRADTRPELIDTTTSQSCVYLRKDIKEVEVIDMDGTARKEFNYLEQELTPAEYAAKVANDNSAKIDYIAMMADIDTSEVA